MSKVAIFGGAFNPITIGHQLVVDSVLANVPEVDQIWLMPCYGHLYGKQLEEASHRLAMCKCLSDKILNTRVFPFEINHKLSGSTWLAVNQMLEEGVFDSFDDFYVIIGQDNANHMDGWLYGQELQAHLNWIVVRRAGSPVTHNWYDIPNNRIVTPPGTKQNASEVSSTKVRNLIAENKWNEAQNLVLPDVWDYIVEHKLYGI